jgi:hypothetical protein
MGARFRMELKVLKAYGVVSLGLSEESSGGPQ